MRFFYFISVFCPLLPILFYIFFKPSRHDRELWIIFFYLLFSFLIDIFKMVVNSTTGKLGVSGVPIFTLMDYIFLFVLFECLITNWKVKQIFRVISILYVLYISFVILSKSADQYTTVSPIESLIVMIFSVHILFGLLNKQDEFFIYSSPIFWIVMAFLVYTSGTLFLYIIRIIDINTAKKWWAINNIWNIISNFLIGLAVIINYKRNKSIHPPPKTQIAESLENS